MYKLLLSWRYLRTRWIALASIISVMLGVATMIVVNSVMQGFTAEMQNRIHGILSDIVFKARSLEGMPDAAWHMEQIRQIAGDKIEAMSAKVEVPAMLNFRYNVNGNDNWMTLPVRLIGIDPKTQSEVSDFSNYLQHPENRKAISFELREGGYDVRDHQIGKDAFERPQMSEAGWKHRKELARLDKFQKGIFKDENQQGALDAAPSSEAAPSVDPFAAPPTPQQDNLFDPEKEQHTGVVLGIAMTSFRLSTGEDKFLALPGDDVKLTYPTAGQPPKLNSDDFTIVDFYESKMSDYDGMFAFMPIDKLQELRGMKDPTTGVRLINAIQIKLKPGVNDEEVRDLLRAKFLPEMYSINTWRDEQGALLAAVHMETIMLNLLLFLIIAVAGFGILAIFYMIVVEKTRDIGILKSLGASSHGVMSIFLAYGLSLGLVGSGVGMAIGLLIVHHINEIANWLAWLTGRPVFDPSIYYFYKIPAIVEPATVAWIVAGALGIAVAASILPARRAARLHPVEALRYE